MLLNCSDSSLEKVEIEISGEKFTVEVADDPESQQKGLMFRDALGEREGMIFVYELDKPLKFWNKNVNFPLSIAFLTKTGMILQIENMNAGDPSSVYSKYSSRYALEVNQGIFNELGVAVGDYITLPPEFTD